MRRTAAAALLFVALGGCENAGTRAARLTGGDPGRGRELVVKYRCGSCHSIPGIEGARGALGPSLDGIHRRERLAGGLPNTPENLRRWIVSPRSVAPGTTMPTLGLSEEEGRHVAAYLYSMR
jgi:cytochrome c